MNRDFATLRELLDVMGHDYVPASFGGRHSETCKRCVLEKWFVDASLGLDKTFVTKRWVVDNLLGAVKVDTSANLGAISISVSQHVQDNGRLYPVPSGFHLQKDTYLCGPKTFERLRGAAGTYVSVMIGGEVKAEVATERKQA